MSTELALLLYGYFLPLVVSYVVVRKYVIKEHNSKPTFEHFACVLTPIINFIVFGAIITYFFEWLFVKSNFIQRAVKWFFLIK
jgi:hypothetical protein